MSRHVLAIAASRIGASANHAISNTQSKNDVHLDQVDVINVLRIITAGQRCAIAVRSANTLI